MARPQGEGLSARERAARGETEVPESKDEAISARKKANIAQKISTGFALMSLVPILLAIYLLRKSGPIDLPSGLFGLDGVIVLLMLASALAGFYFIKSELARTFLQILEQASRNATGGLSQEIREANAEEISKLGETLERITDQIHTGSEVAARSKDKLRSGITKVSQGIQTARGTDHLLDFLAEGALEAVDGRTAYVMGIDEESGDFATKTSFGELAEEVRDARIPLGEGIPGLTARERRPLLLHDLDQLLEGETGPLLSHPPETTMATPLLQGENLLGILIIHDRVDGDRFTDEDLGVLSNLATLASAALGQRQEHKHLEDGLDAILTAFSTAIEEKDPYSRGHSRRVARYCTEMARSLNLDEDTIRLLRRAAILHDIGKGELPDTLRKKEGRFTDEEIEHVRNHPVAAEKLIRSVPELASIGPMIRHHHERCDGTGYPDGLSGDDIPLTTHILIVANAFDVMTSDRSYRQAMSMSDALQAIQQGAGAKFDRRAVHALLGLDKKILKAPNDGPEEGKVKGQGAASISIKD